MLRNDPFRDLDRLARQLLAAGTTSHPAIMPMDAWREAATFVVEVDLPGVSPETVDIDVERNVVTVRAERPPRNGGGDLLAAERPTGQFSRQLVLGEDLDLDRIEAAYDDGVLRLTVPVAAEVQPRKIEVASPSLQRKAPQPAAVDS